MKSGELRELHELQFVGRVRYQHASTFPAALDNLVRRHHHAIIATSLSADLFMADIFTLTGILSVAFWSMLVVSFSCINVLMHVLCECIFVPTHLVPSNCLVDVTPSGG